MSDEQKQQPRMSVRRDRSTGNAVVFDELAQERMFEIRGCGEGYDPVEFVTTIMDRAIEAQRQNVELRRRLELAGLTPPV